MKLIDTLSNELVKLGGKLKDKSPELLIGGGVISILAGTVFACKATTKMDDILDEHDEIMEKIHKLKNKEEVEKKEVVKAYTKTCAKVAFNYAPAGTLIFGGITMILASHNIMVKRNATLLTAYNALDACFRSYRDRVKEELGEEEDFHFYHGTKRIKEEKTVVGENGKKKKVIEEIEEIDPNLPSPYAKFFDCTSSHWASVEKYGPNNNEYNMIFLRGIQDWANRILEIRGYLFLNEVYQELDIDMTDSGAIVGWVNDGHGDGFVDFGIYNINNSATRRFVNGIEKDAILLDFNVDGNIIGKIGWANKNLKKGF